MTETSFCSKIVCPGIADENINAYQKTNYLILNYFEMPLNAELDNL